MSSKKKVNLQAALTRESAREPDQPSVGKQSGQEVSLEDIKADAVEKVTPKRSSKPASRRGTKQIAGHFDAAAHKQLRLMCVEQETTVQRLLQEALNDLFTKYGKSPVA